MGYTNFKAEAAIVNYYHMGSTLSAHTDHSEVNLEAPLYSFRFVNNLNKFLLKMSRYDTDDYFLNLETSLLRSVHFLLFKFYQK